MSLDMTIGAGRMDAVAEANVERSRVAPDTWLWLRNLVLVAGTTLAVAFSSALSVVLYLH